MKDTRHLHELDKLKQEQLDKLHCLEDRYEHRAISQSSYDDQVRGVNNSIDIIGKEIDKEIENQGLSEQEYLEAREEWQEEERQEERGR
jgi:hypothetical protein